jgi:type IV fimbrial biogenesis protein FimT
MDMMEARNMKKFSRTTHSGSFFYSPKKPIIGKYTPLVCASICYNTPSICNKRSFGFTLVELLITLSVVSILALIATPSLSRIIASQRMSTNINELIASITLARSEAIKSSNAVIVCSNTTAAPTSCSGSTNWSQGWLVWVDRNNSGTVNPDPGEAIQVHSALAGPGSVMNSGIDRIIYSRSGFIAVATTRRFEFCDQRGASFAKAVVLDTIGRPEIDKATAIICP